MPSGLGPYYDCSDAGIAAAIGQKRERAKREAREHRKAEKRVLEKIARNQPITPEEQREFGGDIRISSYSLITDKDGHVKSGYVY